MTLRRPQELTEEERTAWRTLVESEPHLASPFLRPEFVCLVAKQRSDVQVAVIMQQGRPVGFLPFQRDGAVGRPVAGGLSDCQAAILPESWGGDTKQLVRAAGLGVLEFTQVLAEQRLFAPGHRHRTAAPAIALKPGGFEAYAEDRRAAGSNVVTQTLSHARRLERRLGKLRFVLHDPDPRMLDLLIAWKRAQYREERWGGALDLFARPWTGELLARIHATQQPGFAGVLSTLHAGDTLVAAHMGMRSHSVLHYWFPSYDAAHAKLAPGRILLLDLIRAAAASGLSRIELGAGDEGYKARFANAATPVAAGFVGPPSLALLRCRLWQAVSELARHVPLGRGRRADELVFRREWLRAHS